MPGGALPGVVVGSRPGLVPWACPAIPPPLYRAGVWDGIDVVVQAVSHHASKLSSLLASLLASVGAFLDPMVGV